MLLYVARRLLVAIPVLFGVSLLTFAMVKTLPGDAVVYLLGDLPSYRDMADMRHALGLDEPLPLQFLRYVQRVMSGDLGTSLISQTAIAPELARRASLTLQVGTLGLAFGVIAGSFLGVFSAVRRGSPEDMALRVLALVGVSTPTFVSGVLLMYVFAFQLDLFPISGYFGPASLVLPAATLGLVIAGAVMRVTRSSLLEVIGQDYVRTARAKGLHERVVIARHALRNSLLVLVTLVGLQFGYLMGGAIVIETVFALPGIGSYALDGIRQRDLPVVQAVVLFVAASFALVNLAVDLLYGVLDPRIRIN